MGYYASQTRSYFLIKRENVAKALAAVKELAGVEQERGSGFTSEVDENGQRITVNRYSWVDDDYVTADTFEKALVSWRWEAFIAPNGDVEDLRFDGEKLGDDAQLMNALAPFVEHGCYIEMCGEDDARWRWVFWRGELREEYPKVIWEYESLTPAMELAEEFSKSA